MSACHSDCLSQTCIALCLKHNWVKIIIVLSVYSYRRPSYFLRKLILVKSFNQERKLNMLNERCMKIMGDFLNKHFGCYDNENS